MDERTQLSGKILVVDDQPEICSLFQTTLEGAGYAVQGAEDGQSALRSFFNWRPSMVITDVRMPVMDGWDLLSRIREVSDVPVIMLTAMGTDTDKVRGLRGGADDYLVKPITMSELVARVGARFRRHRSQDGASENQVYQDAAIQVDFSAHRVSLRGHSVELSPLEYRVLCTLVSNPGTVFSVERLLDLCWDSEERGPESVRVYIGYLRKKLPAGPGLPQLIETVREFGYRYQPASV